MKPIMPYKRNYRSQSSSPTQQSSSSSLTTTSTSPLTTFLPTKPTHVINLFNSNPEINGYINTSTPQHQPQYKSTITTTTSTTLSSPFSSNHFEDESNTINRSGDGLIHSLKKNISYYYQSIFNRSSNKIANNNNDNSVFYDTDDYYEYRNLSPKSSSLLNEIISPPKTNVNSQPSTLQQQQQQQQIIDTKTTTLLTTTTTTTTTTTFTSSSIAPNIAPPPQPSPNQLIQSDYLESYSSESTHFLKNGAIHLPSPCFKTYNIPKDNQVEKQIINHQPSDEHSKLNYHFNNICNIILSDSKIKPQDRYKAKLCIGFCFTVVSFIPSWIIFFLLSGLKEPALMAILSLPMSGSSLWVLRKTGSTHYPGHMLCFTLCFALTMNSYYTGGHQSTLRLLMSTLPIVSALVIGRRASVQWSFVVLIILLLFFIANLLGFEYVDGIPTITIRSHMNFIIDVTLVLITMSFTLCYQYFIDEAHRETKIKNQQLTVAKDAAVEAYQARQEFLATMSHEIRTPLNGLIGMATLLRDSLSLPPEEKQMAKSVKSCGDILLRLVNDILDLSKLEANQMVVENIAFNVTDMAHEICQVLAGQAKEHNLSLHFEVSKKVPQVLFGDTGRILQVLMNLTGNAIKFTPEGVVKIIIDLIEDESEKISFRDGEYNICFRVQDTGIGVPPESHQKIFEAFVQADPSDSRKYGGSGLGLYLCAKLVKLMRGEIGVYNNPHGAGSTFWFILPLQGGDESMGQPNSASNMDSSTIIYNCGGPKEIRVLVAEDNVINQRVAVKFLEKIGIKAMKYSRF